MAACWLTIKLLTIGRSCLLLLALNTPVKELGLDSKDILKWPNPGEVILVLDEEMEKFCRDYEHQQVSVEGHLFHAHTSHHYTPMLLDVKRILD